MLIWLPASFFHECLVQNDDFCVPAKGPGGGVTAPKVLQRPGVLYSNSSHWFVVQSLSCVWLVATPWTAAWQAFLSFTVSWSLLKLMSIKSVMPSNHLILCRPLLLPSIFPRIISFCSETCLYLTLLCYLYTFCSLVQPLLFCAL